jgi:hypothetical protein
MARAAFGASFQKPAAADSFSKLSILLSLPGQSKIVAQKSDLIFDFLQSLFQLFVHFFLFVA